MIPTAFAYDRPASLDEALGMLAVHGHDIKVLAGGQSLLPLLKMRLAHAERLVDIGRIAELRARPPPRRRRAGHRRAHHVRGADGVRRAAVRGARRRAA